MRSLLVSLGRVGLEEALARQAQARERVIGSSGPPTVFILEHEPVFTIGRAGVRRRFAAGDPRRWPSVLRPAHPVVELDRGGDVTWHGPGQLVVYPVLPLKRLGLSLAGYLRALERAGIAALASYGVRARAREGLTGVWVGDSKIGAIGVGSRRCVAYHGMSLNVSCDLTAFDAITPCGLEGVRVTSLAEVMPGPPPSIDDLGRAVAESLAREVGLELVTGDREVRVA